MFLLKGESVKINAPNNTHANTQKHTHTRNTHTQTHTHSAYILYFWQAAANSQVIRVAKLKKKVFNWQYSKQKTEKRSEATMYHHTSLRT